MKTILNWRKGLFKNTYEIFSDGKPAGSLKENFMKQTAEGEFNGKKVVFKTSGFFRQETVITDTGLQKVIGKISYNSWKTKAEIELEGKKLSWKYDNSWNTKWSLSDSAGILATFKSNTSGGEIEAESSEGLLLLTGLYITNYFGQSTIFIMLIVLFVVII